jgi:hypothetical protein
MRTVTCQDQAGLTVNIANCDAAHPLVSMQACNIDPCPVYSWTGGPWSTCSAPCGVGTQTRQVDCISSIGNVVVASTLCNVAIMPTASQQCNTDACVVPRWVADTWGNCSAICGGGTQTRIVRCLNPDNSPATSGACTDPQPGTAQSCSLVACASYTWKACPTFYPCTAQCNGGGAMVGIQYRDVFCYREQDLTVVDNSLCTIVKPTSQLSVCNPQKCTKPNWMADANWGACVQGTDGVWVRTRTFHCHNADGTAALYSVCKADAGPLPIAILPCSPGTCSDSNGCPSVQIGSVFNDCSNGLSVCTVQCAATASQLADELNVLGLTPTLAAQCVRDLVAALPASFRPAPGLVDSMATTLASGQQNVCGAALSASTHVTVSWTALALAPALAVLF